MISRTEVIGSAKRHSVHGVASKGQRKPLRSATLLSAGGLLGGLLGGAAGWLAARKTA